MQGTRGDVARQKEFGHRKKGEEKRLDCTYEGNSCLNRDELGIGDFGIGIEATPPDRKKIFTVGCLRDDDHLYLLAGNFHLSLSLSLIDTHTSSGVISHVACRSVLRIPHMTYDIPHIYYRSISAL